MIARLINGNISPCPFHGKDSNGRYHSNLTAYYERHLDEAKLDEYYPVRNTEKPEGNYTASWSLVNDEILQVWTPYTPVPEPDIDLEKLRSDVDYIAMMSDIDLDGDLF